MVLQQHRVADGEDCIGYRLTDDLLSAQGFANERACSYWTTLCIGDREPRPVFSAPQVKRHRLLVFRPGPFSPRTENQVEVSWARKVAGGPFYEIGRYSRFTPINITPNTLRHVSAALARSECSLVIWIDYELKLHSLPILTNSPEQICLAKGEVL